MQAAIGESSTGAVVSGPFDTRTARILARTFFKDLQSHGLPEEKILEVASELIGLVTEKIKGDAT